MQSSEAGKRGEGTTKKFVSPSFFPSFALGKRGLLFKGERI